LSIFPLISGKKKQEKSNCIDWIMTKAAQLKTVHFWVSIFKFLSGWWAENC